MSMRMKFGVAAAALLGAALFGGVAQAKSATVGDFLVEVAKAKSLVAADGLSAQAALTAAGVVLPPVSLDKALTEGDVAQIGVALGVNVTTSNPTAPIGTEQVQSFISTFGKVFSGDRDTRQETRDFPNPGTDNGKGKKKGHFKSPTDPV
jgi:hypothetical protein